MRANSARPELSRATGGAVVFVYIKKGRGEKGRQRKWEGGRKSRLLSRQVGSAPLSPGTLERQSGRDSGASGSRKCQKQGELFHGGAQAGWGQVRKLNQRR